MEKMKIEESKNISWLLQLKSCKLSNVAADEPLPSPRLATDRPARLAARLDNTGQAQPDRSKNLPDRQPRLVEDPDFSGLQTDSL